MFDIDAMSLEILNRQSEVRSLPEELEAVKGELRVYEDMQSNLNTNLAMYPAFLDAIENLQCSVYPEDEIPSPYQMATDVYDMYLHDLKAEVKRLREKLDDRERQLGIYDITLQLALENELRLEQELAKIRPQAQMAQDYRDNADRWRDYYYFMNKYKEPSC